MASLAPAKPELRRSTTPPPTRRALPKPPAAAKPGAPSARLPPRGPPPAAPPRVAPKQATEAHPPLPKRGSVAGSGTSLLVPPVVVSNPPPSPIVSPGVPPQKERQAKRVYIAKEICSTEENYVGNLSDLITLFKNPIEASGLIPPEQCRPMFGNVEALAGLHQMLLSNLKERMAKFDDNTCVADVICTLIPYMKLYTEYINAFDAAQHLLSEALKRPEVAALVETLGTPIFKGYIGLSSLALTPVLRIPRYVLLLQDLKKNTVESHPDYPNICLAFEKASVMAHYINETKRRDERRRRMVTIASHLKGDVECLRYCLVQDPQSVKPHQWSAKKFIIPTKCEVCQDHMGPFSDEGRECNDCSLSVHAKCQTDAPEQCGPRPEPTILAHFRRLLLDGKAKHRIFRPKHSNHRELKRESRDFTKRDAIVAIFNDAILIVLPDDPLDDKSSLVISGWLPWHNRARTQHLEITDSPDTLGFSLVCPRTLDTHMLEFDNAVVKKEWLDMIRDTMKDWSANINQIVLAPPDPEPAPLAQQPPLFHASQTLPKDRFVHVDAASGVTFQIPATVPVWDAKEGKEFTAYVVEAKIQEKDGATHDVSLMKRYSQFDEMHLALEKHFKKPLADKGTKFPELPKKRWFGNTDPDFVKQRCKGLEQYLAGIAAIPELMASDELQSFLRASLDSRGPAEEGKEIGVDSDTSPRTSRAGSLTSMSGDINSSHTHVSPNVLAAAASPSLAPSLTPSPHGLSRQSTHPKAKVLYDFVSGGPTELGLKAGDVVELHNTTDVEWWFGSCKHSEGYFPATYVEREPP